MNDKRVAVNNMMMTSKAGWELLTKAQKILPYEETVCKCYRVPIGRVRVQRNEEGNTRISGTVTCKSAWSCPICSIRRARERARVIDVLSGKILNETAMITYTLQHNPIDKLDYLIELLYQSLRDARMGSRLARFNQHALGYIRATEIRYGRAGWHPHIHELVWLNKGASIEGMTSTVVTAYKEQLRRAGRNVNQYTVKLETWDGKTDYVTKDVDTRELTHEWAKEGDKSLTPFGILDMSEGNPRMANLFNEYHFATKRRKKLIVSRSLDSWYKEAKKEIQEDLEDVSWQDVKIFTNDEWLQVIRNNARYNIIMSFKEG